MWFLFCLLPRDIWGLFCLFTGRVFRCEFTLSKDSKKIYFHFHQNRQQVVLKSTTHSSDKFSSPLLWKHTSKSVGTPPTSVQPKLVAAQCLVCGLTAPIFSQPSRCVRWRLKRTLTVIKNMTEIGILRLHIVAYGCKNITTGLNKTTTGLCIATTGVFCDYLSLHIL